MTLDDFDMVVDTIEDMKKGGEGYCVRVVLNSSVEHHGPWYARQGGIVRIDDLGGETAFIMISDIAVIMVDFQDDE